MLPPMADRGWVRRGLSLVWNAEALGTVAGPDAAWTMRQLLTRSRAWPAALPSSNGEAVVVAGFDSCLDAFGPDAAEVWIQRELVPVMLSFQEEYDGQAALIFWLPEALRRLTHSSADGSYSWRWAGRTSVEPLALGRCLWAGAEADLRRIVVPAKGKVDPTGPGWIGLHLARLS
ncbi:MAG: hypothetical protein HY903_22035 [Deltaproteobacteria bacterium]|nr:hypothetical protein [Deltaproteobacteria bacterium]